MKKSHKKWSSLLICAALIMTLFITACGASTSPASTSDAASAAAVESTDTEKTADDLGISSSDIGGIIYDANDIEISLTGITQEQGYAFLDFSITNKGSKTLQIELYPLVINGSLSISEGAFEDIEPGATAEPEAYVEMALPEYAGITSIDSIEGYVVINDPENYYEPIGEPERITIVAGDKDGSSSAIEHSDQVIYDSDGICISYLGSYKDEYYGNEAVFFVTNKAADPISIGSPWMEETIDGEPSGEKYMSFNGATVMPGDCALTSSYILNSETYHPVDYTTLDMDITVGMSNRAWIPENIPCHLKLENDSLVLTADAPYITDDMLKYKEYLDQEAAEQAHEEAVAANAEDVKDPEIVKTGIYNYQVGTSYNNAIISALVHNPNERTSLYHVELTCKAYDADNNLLDEPRLYYYNDFTILPGAAVPFEFNINSIDLSKTVDHVEITVNSFDSVNELDLDTTASIYNLEVPTADIHLDNAVVSEGAKDDRPSLFWPGASLSGTLVNDGDDAEMAYIIYVLYDQNGEIILCGKVLESDLPHGEIPDYYREFGPAVYELPGYDHVDITCFKKAAAID